MIKKFLVCVLIATPFLLVPNQSKAQDDNGNGKDKGNHYGENKHDPPTSAAPTSVPVNGGLIILMAAGLGLGAKVIFDAKRSNGEQAIA